MATGATVAVCLAACGTDGAGAGSDSVRVLAAASLADILPEIAAAFEAEHDVDVALSFGASSVLAVQVVEGAPADVFISADEVNLRRLRDADLTGGAPTTVAINALQIAVAPGNPHAVTGLADLRQPDLRLALCAVAVPCGRYAAAAFARAGLDVPPASQEDNVRGVLTKVGLGEADAGIVYVTDVRASDDVEGVALDHDHQVRATYPATVLADAPSPDVARAFVRFLRGAIAQRLLTAAGFGLP